MGGFNIDFDAGWESLVAYDAAYFEDDMGCLAWLVPVCIRFRCWYEIGLPFLLAVTVGWTVS